ncbi:hypothetical protein ACIQF6_09325 [Kitasatospora sp. NPDC092948]|uniref:hypothetical protein n=1 Tax=Kitasatospora sp. NPDC092948 TaxID=3364088 RepID=UPI00382C15A0
MRTSRLLAASAFLTASFLAPLALGATTATASVKPCDAGEYVTKVTASWPGYDQGAQPIVLGAPALESAISFTNPDKLDVPRYAVRFTVKSDAGDAVSPFDVQYELPGSNAWKPVDRSAWTPAADGHSLQFDVPTFALPKNSTAKLGLRIAAPGGGSGAGPGDYRFGWSGDSGFVDNDSQTWIEGTPSPWVSASPENPAGTCTVYRGEGAGHVSVITPPSPSPTPTPTPTPTPSRTTAQAAPKPELAETGGGTSALPLALGGGAALVVGVGILVVLRRRGGSHR